MQREEELDWEVVLAVGLGRVAELQAVNSRLESCEQSNVLSEMQ